MAAKVNSPGSLLKDSSGNIFFYDFIPGQDQAVLRKITQSGNVTTITSILETNGLLTNDLSGNFYTRIYLVVNGEGAWRIEVINQAGNISAITIDISQIPAEFSSVSKFVQTIYRMTYRPSDRSIYTAHGHNNTGKIFKINPQGVVTLFVSVPDNPTPVLTFIHFTSSNDMVIVNQPYGKIYRADSTGAIKTTISHSLGQVNTLTLDDSNNIYVPINAAIYKYDTSNTQTLIAGTPGQPGFADGTSASFSWQLYGIVVVNGNIYVSDNGNRRIRESVYSGGIYSTYTVAGDGTSGTDDGKATIINPLGGGGAPPCFLEGTQILCRGELKDEYLPVESLVPGTLVKTSLNGYKRITLIGSGPIENPGNEERVKQRLYKLSTSNYPELNEDLFITGCHSRLVHELTDKQREETIKHINRVFVTDKQYRLMACVDENAEPWNSKGTYTIWHFALEHENIKMNYGVYANGLLVESCCIDTLKNKSNFRFLS